MRRPAHCVALVALLSSLACAAEPETPEGRIRGFLAAMEEAAEDRDLGPLKAAVAEGYADDRGNDRTAIVQLLMVHFLRNQSIHLLSRIATVEIAESATASATVYVGVAGRPIPDAAALAVLRADLYRFDFELARKDEEWQVTRAEWHPARGDDFP
jgi:hypothetical protein